MIKRNLPLILFLLVFIVLLRILFSFPRAVKESIDTFVPKQEEQINSFSGRVIMPKFDDIYVLENSSKRDIVQLEHFLQGRAAGLHFLAESYFKGLKKQNRKNKKIKDSSNDIIVGIRVTLDSLGFFELNEYVFSNIKDENFKQSLYEHIKYYWRFPKCNIGKLEFWIPIRWMFNYK